MNGAMGAYVFKIGIAGSCSVCRFGFSSFGKQALLPFPCYVLSFKLTGFLAEVSSRLTVYLVYMIPVIGYGKICFLLTIDGCKFLDGGHWSASWQMPTSRKRNRTIF